ncbi:MAG TPA: hypothetical protein VJJ52_05110 [Candidatus Nanoarchaeia archaeon]|nr:hypothetical protein [Candidatus Nanoarchaeia archaeon]
MGDSADTIIHSPEYGVSQLADYVLRNIPQGQGMTGMDHGAGSGRHTFYYTGQGNKMIAVEKDPTRIAELSRRADAMTRVLRDTDFTRLIVNPFDTIDYLAADGEFIKFPFQSGTI